MNDLIHRAATDGNTICRQPLDTVHHADVMHPDAVTCPICSRNATDSSDPAHFLLTDGVTSTTTVYNAGCYICADPEFSAMGLPLCYPCPKCGAHTPADDITCDNGHDTYPEEAQYQGPVAVITDVVSPLLNDTAPTTSLREFQDAMRAQIERDRDAL